jgi:hypothetical protein
MFKKRMIWIPWNPESYDLVSVVSMNPQLKYMLLKEDTDQLVSSFIS